jgi:hypothetical protein
MVMMICNVYLSLSLMVITNEPFSITMSSFFCRWAINVYKNFICMMIFCDTPGCYSSAAEDFSLLACDTMLSGMWFRVFWVTSVFVFKPQLVKEE